MEERSWRFVPVVGLLVLVLSFLDDNRALVRLRRRDGTNRADLAVAFTVTMGFLIGVVLVLLTVASFSVLH
jgi:hypothetical protein